MTLKYSTREEAATSLSEESQRVQYDEGDLNRVADAAAALTTHVVELIEALGNYANETTAEVSEDSEARMGYARRNTIEKWATAQLALSKVAFVLRIDGDAAYRRLVEALSTENGNIDMRGL